MDPSDRHSSFVENYTKQKIEWYLPSTPSNLREHVMPGQTELATLFLPVVAPWHCASHGSICLEESASES